MYHEQIIQNAHILLEQMSDYPNEIAAALTPIEGAVVVDTLAMLAKKSATMQNSADLQAVANAIYTLVEEMPGLSALLLPENLNLAQAYQQRSVTLEDFEATVPKKQAPPGYNYRNEFLIIHENLDRLLPKLDEVQESEATNRKLGLWDRLKLKLLGRTEEDFAKNDTTRTNSGQLGSERG